MNYNELKTIESESDYHHANELLDKVIDAAPDSKDALILEILTLQIAEYEDRHHQIEAPDPIYLIKYLIDEGTLTVNLLEDILDCRYARVWEYLNRRRPIPLNGLRKLHKYGLPADALLQPYEIQTA